MPSSLSANLFEHLPYGIIDTAGTVVKSPLSANLFEHLPYGVAFLAGCIFAALIARVRGQAMRRLHAAKLEREVALAKKDSEIKSLEERARFEAEARRAEDEARARANELERLRLDAARLNEDLAARAEQARLNEEESARLREETERELKRYREGVLALARMTHEEARAAASEHIRHECAAEIARERQEILGRSEDEVRAEARRVLVDTMQRIAPTVTNETNAALVPIPNEEMKGRLIGREGRNIKSFEQETGTTLLIDEAPDTVLVSAFDPVRREIARLALEALIRDGRIHPANIEDFVERAREEVLKNAAEYGRRAATDLGVAPLPPEVTELLGRLHFRLSVNQNTLAHSVEVATLAGLVAAEFGLDVALARRAGLLHDIGKALEAEHGGSHAAAGAALLRQHAEDPRVINAVAAHHEEVPAESIYAPIVMLADRVSAARPGARAQTLGGYVDRLRNLEDIAKSFTGVSEAYAVRAGRELRVSIEPARLNEVEAKETARRIRRRIEDEVQFTGVIRITVIREQRFTEEAK
ncbi:MAG: ribonuclease Y [Puniceicoccales bacterium]|jgi:ribonuclease Y|nr:ribonuclease Y [Puniceicoccales bacterium]